jgi:hypothetical protein
VLSERERRALHEIEQAMISEAPGLAGALTQMGPDPRWSRRRHDLTLLSFGMAALLCLVVGATAAGLTALLFGAAVLAIRWRRFPPGGDLVRRC